jgi:hypothetical protein
MATRQAEFIHVLAAPARIGEGARGPLSFVRKASRSLRSYTTHLGSIDAVGGGRLSAAVDEQLSTNWSSLPGVPRLGINTDTLAAPQGETSNKLT